MPGSSELATCLEGAARWLQSVWDGKGLILTLTGAGISAESGVPTFRGEEGYWRIGSRNYFPEELATNAAFLRMPAEIWGWYLYRRSVCTAASPNAGHLALAELERGLVERGEGDRFLLVTQNVDGLHQRAGNSLSRTFQIHGNLNFMRSAEPGATEVHPLPKALGTRWERGRAPDARELGLLVCPNQEALARPHVLWFDEVYDEALFRFESTLTAAESAGLVIVVGTSGATTLPSLVMRRTLQRGIPVLVVNREQSPFTDLAQKAPNGYFIQGPAGEMLPPLVDLLLDGELPWGDSEQDPAD